MDAGTGCPRPEGWATHPRALPQNAIPHPQRSRKWPVNGNYCLLPCVQIFNRNFMNTSIFRFKLTLAAVALLLAGVVPGRAAKSVERTEVFTVAAKTKIEVGTNHHATLAAISVGDHVSVTYNDESGSLVAHQVSDNVPHKPHVPTEPPANPKVPAPHAKKPSIYSHVRGVVKAINVAAGTLTVAYKGK